MDTFLHGNISSLTKAWSDEARAAALEHRRQNAGMHGEPTNEEHNPLPENPHSGAPQTESTQGGAETHEQAVGTHGWEHMGEHPMVRGSQIYSHPTAGGELTIHPNGGWRHQDDGGIDVRGNNKDDMAQYLSALHGQTEADQPSQVAPDDKKQKFPMAASE